jgi:hypothetical protein
VHVNRLDNVVVVRDAPLKRIYRSMRRNIACEIVGAAAFSQLCGY